MPHEKRENKKHSVSKNGAKQLFRKKKVTFLMKKGGRGNFGI